MQRVFVCVGVGFSGWWEFRISIVRRRWISGSGLKVHFASALDFPGDGLKMHFASTLDFPGGGFLSFSDSVAFSG